MRSAAHVADAVRRHGGRVARGTRTQFARGEMDPIVGRMAVTVMCHSLGIASSTCQRCSVPAAADGDIVTQVTRNTRRVGPGLAACASRIQVGTAICARYAGQMTIAARCTRRRTTRVQRGSVLSACHGTAMALAARGTRRTKRVQRGLVLTACDGTGMALAARFTRGSRRMTRVQRGSVLGARDSTCTPAWRLPQVGHAGARRAASVAWCWAHVTVTSWRMPHAAQRAVGRLGMGRTVRVCSAAGWSLQLPCELEDTTTIMLGTRKRKTNP